MNHPLKNLPDSRTAAGGLALIAMAIILLISCSTVLASKASYAKLIEGYQQWKQGNDKSALDCFRAATRIDPDDAQAWLLVGTAYNQLDEPGNAIKSLKRASQLACQDPELFFQTGRAQIRLGDFESAVSCLKQFESVEPGRGQTSEFLGRAYMAIGNYPKARDYFDQSLLRDKSLRSTVLVEQARLAQLTNDQQAATDRLDDLRWYAGNSSTAAALRPTLDAMSFDELTTTRPLQVSVALSGGYNTQVRGVSAVLVEGNRSDVRSEFGETDLAASYTWSGPAYVSDNAQPQQMVISTAFDFEGYPQAKQGDFYSDELAIDYSRPLIGPISGSLKFSGEYDSLSRRGFRTNFTGRGALQWHLNDRFLIETACTGAHDDFLFATTPVQDPDARSYIYSLDACINLTPKDVAADRVITARIGGFFNLNRSDGSDFDYNGGGLNVELDAPVFEHIRGQLLYTWSENRYLNLNSLTAAPIPGTGNPFPFPQYRRNDSTNSVSIKLMRSMREWSRHLTLFAGYEYNNNSSNIELYKFSQHIVTAGLRWDL